MSRIDGEDQLGLSVFTSKNGIVYFRVWMKGDKIKMDKNFFNKRCHYSIRNLSIGIASVIKIRCFVRGFVPSFSI